MTGKAQRNIGYRTDLERVVPAMDMIVSCSHREGLGLNVIEAMLCKKPVVAAINCGHRELVRDGENGYLFTAGDADRLAELIEKLYKDEPLRLTLGEAGAWLAERYTVDAVKKEMGRILV